MGIVAYKKDNASGVQVTVYMAVAEGINRYTGQRVQMRRRSILSKPKAERIYRELWSACRERKPDDSNLKTWGELHSHYLEYLRGKIRSIDNVEGFSPQVFKSKKSRLSHSDSWVNMHLDLVTPIFVWGKLDEMELGGSSRSTTNHLLKEIKCTFAYGVHVGAIKVNPFVAVKLRRMPKKRKKALTHEEANKLLAEAKARRHPFYRIWLLTLALGLRRSELAGLQWTDVNLEHRLIYLNRQNIPGEGIVLFLKDKEDRVVAIPEFVIPELKKMKLEAKTDCVIEIKDHRWTDGSQAEVLREFCREIGIKEITHHQLRSTHITLSIVDGVSLGAIKENVGHASLITTNEYFSSSGINMIGQTDKLKIRVPQDGLGEVLPLKSVK
jgi:integrase